MDRYWKCFKGFEEGNKKNQCTLEIITLEAVWRIKGWGLWQSFVLKFGIKMKITPVGMEIKRAYMSFMELDDNKTWREGGYKKMSGRDWKLRLLFCLCWRKWESFPELWKTKMEACVEGKKTNLSLDKLSFLKSFIHEICMHQFTIDCVIF